jgi:hypothetical protein
MSWLSSAFGSQKNPAKEANKYLDQIPAAMKPYFDQFINQGQQAGQQLQGQYNQMTQDPNALITQLTQGYKESPGYQFKLQQALGAGQNASAAGGMLGTPQDQQQQMGVANDIASKDWEDYLNHILGIFGAGQAGQQGLQEQGFKASTGYGENLGNVLGQKAQYGYAGTAGANANKANNWSNAFKVGGAVLGAL